MTDPPRWRRAYGWSIQHGYLALVNAPVRPHARPLYGEWGWELRRLEDSNYVAASGFTATMEDAMLAADRAAREESEARSEVASRNQDLYTASEDEM